MILFWGSEGSLQNEEEKNNVIALIVLSTMPPKNEGRMSVVKRSDRPQCPGSHVSTIVAKMEIGHCLK